MKPSIFVSVDRADGDIVVVVADDGRSFELARKNFKTRPAEGTIYRVSVNDAGEPKWASMVRDAAETTRRRKELKARMDALRCKDDGGDIKL
jgi:hypothetical protein